MAASGSSRDAGDDSDVVPEMRTVLRFGWLSATIRSSPSGDPVVAQMESPCAASSAATMMRVRVSMSRAYSGLSDFYGDIARSCCLCISLACCAGVSD